ncbi:hypothetical protein F5B19DRAFT_442591 [Rostrohypoxylon terebratum]|nr:hypothetical protein F5B19DRAFT_442591 [Rostrohypoxylon terebratum]
MSETVFYCEAVVLRPPEFTSELTVPHVDSFNSIKEIRTVITSNSFFLASRVKHTKATKKKEAISLSDVHHRPPRPRARRARPRRNRGRDHQHSLYSARSAPPSSRTVRESGTRFPSMRWMLFSL